ncbi:hypothetical protein BGX31_010526 [Mortierella sp. GBA43]|nr:hypothetical protein BGX31_010526 [Mortierella sp. GBA43]
MDAFSTVLRMCPNLETLDIRRTPIYRDACSGPFLHEGLISLYAPLQQLCQPDPDIPLSSTMLIHFPNLEMLTTWDTPNIPYEPPFDLLERQAARYCPRIREVRTSSSAATTVSILTRSFQNLSAIEVRPEDISTDVIATVVSHAQTLKSFTTFFREIEEYDQEEVVEDVDVCLAEEQEIQLIPHTCPKLTKLDLPTLEMDMDDVEKTTWSCTQLEELYIRIRGLDTKERIDRAIQLWLEYRSAKKANGDTGDTAALPSLETQASGSAQPSSEEAQPASSAQPSLEETQPAGIAEPSLDEIQPSGTAQPSSEEIQPSSTAQSSFEETQPSSTAQPSSEETQPSSTAQPSSEETQPSGAGQPSSEETLLFGTPQPPPEETQQEDTAASVETPIEAGSEETRQATAASNGTPIEERVARHLARFDKLRKVWLGRRTKSIMTRESEPKDTAEGNVDQEPLRTGLKEKE